MDNMARLAGDHLPTLDQKHWEQSEPEHGNSANEGCSAKEAWESMHEISRSQDNFQFHNTMGFKQYCTFLNNHHDDGDDDDDEAKDKMRFTRAVYRLDNE